MENIAKYREILKNCRILNDIDEAELPALLRKMDARLNHFEKGEDIFPLGCLVKDMAIVLEGEAVVGYSASDGSETELYLLGPASDLGIHLAAGGGQRLQMRVYASCRSTLLFLRLEPLMRAHAHTEAEVQLLSNALRSCAEKCSSLYDRVHIYAQKRMRARIRLYLMGLERKDDEVQLPVNRTQMAAQLGVDRAAMTRELARMQNEGLIALSRRSVRLLDAAFFKI